jgi:tetratricopeptide (TPR) repeat protein
MDSAQVLARFEAERQALALMDHPNIARVFDAGATADGRPFFVMELVRGVPITRYCDEHRLTPRQRLELFVPVCQAIQHAHQKGVIHRDVKPGNVLVAVVDDRPVPKVIDFGVAKATGPQLTDRTLHTGLGTVVGTVEYMSPEQACVEQTDVDTRSDIYSLGVLLYELLAGSPPFTRKELEQAGVLEMFRVIREREPSKPSTKLGTADGLPTLAANRGTEPAKLTRQLRGELDWIVMKALEKDRTRRYDTATGLALDVQRYLANEPVSAGPPSATYRLRKFVRRNRPAVALATVVLFSLVLLGGTAGWFVRDQEARRARLVGQFDGVLDEVARLSAEQKWPEALAAALRAESMVAGGGGDLELERQVRDVLTGLSLLRRLEEIRLERETPKEGEPGAAWAVRAYAAAFREHGVGGDELTRDDLATFVRTRPQLAVPLAAALDDWAICRVSILDDNGAKNLRAIAHRIDPDPWRRRVRNALADKDADALEVLAASPDLLRQPPTTLERLGIILWVKGKKEAGIAVLRKAQKQYPADFWINVQLGFQLSQNGPDHQDESIGFFRAATALRPQSMFGWYYIGVAYRRKGDLEEAAYYLRRAVEIPPNSAVVQTDFGYVLILQKKYDEAAVQFRKAIEIRPRYPLAHHYLGVVLSLQGEREMAVRMMWKSLELKPDYEAARQALSRLVRANPNRDATVAFFREAVRAAPDNALAHWYLGSALWYAKRRDESLAAFERAVELAPADGEFRYSLANNYRDLNRPDKAVTAYVKAVELNPKSAPIRYEYAAALRRKGRLAEAVATWKTAVELDATHVRSHAALAWHLATAADTALRDPAEAVRHARIAVDLAPESAGNWSNLGVALWRAADVKAALDALKKAQVMTKDGDMFHRFFLALAYARAGDLEKAKAAYEQAVRWSEENRPGNEELKRFRAEAEEVLKLGKK